MFKAMSESMHSALWCVRAVRPLKAGCGGLVQLQNLRSDKRLEMHDLFSFLCT